MPAKKSFLVKGFRTIRALMDFVIGAMNSIEVMIEVFLCLKYFRTFRTLDIKIGMHTTNVICQISSTGKRCSTNWTNVSVLFNMRNHVNINSSFEMRFKSTVITFVLIFISLVNRREMIFELSSTFKK
jgi:hypothetical protein